MRVDISTWRCRIGNFHLSYRSIKQRNGRKPLRGAYSHLFIPGLTWLILALCLTPLSLQYAEYNQPWTTPNLHSTSPTWFGSLTWLTPWSTPRLHIANSKCLSGSMQVNTTLTSQQTTFLTDHPFIGKFYHNIGEQHGRPEVILGHWTNLLFFYHQPSMKIAQNIYTDILLCDIGVHYYSGNINPTSDDTTSDCNIYNSEVDTEKGLQCYTCDIWIHPACINVNKQELETFEQMDIPFLCPTYE